MDFFLIMNFLIAVSIMVLLKINNTNSESLCLVSCLFSSILFLVSFCLFFNGESVIVRIIYSPLYELSWTYVIDGLSIIFIVLTALIIMLICFGSISITRRLKEKYILLFVIEFLLINAFAVNDIFIFYVLFEAVLIPMYMLIGLWGSRKQKVFAANYFFLYTLFGSFFMLSGMVYVYMLTNSLSPIILNENVFLDSKIEVILGLMFFLPLAIKIPMVPGHLWLLRAHVEAPTTGSVLLAGVLLKLGSYGFMRFWIPYFSHAAEILAPLIISLSIISIWISSLSIFRQTDIKSIIAYSSIAHMNYLVGALFTNNMISVYGSLMLQVAHGLASSGLFFCVGFLYDRYGSRNLFYLRGLSNLMPFFSFMFILFCLSNIGFPGSMNFISEFLILLGFMEYSLEIGILVSVGILLSGFYMFIVSTRLIFGQIAFNLRNYADLSRREFYILLLLLFFVLFLGVFPEFFLYLFEPQNEILDFVFESSLEQGPGFKSIKEEPKGLYVLLLYFFLFYLVSIFTLISLYYIIRLAIRINFHFKTYVKHSPIFFIIYLISALFFCVFIVIILAELIKLNLSFSSILKELLSFSFLLTFGLMGVYLFTNGVTIIKNFIQFINYIFAVTYENSSIITIALFLFKCVLGFLALPLLFHLIKFIIIYIELIQIFLLLTEKEVFFSCFTLLLIYVCIFISLCLDGITSNKVLLYKNLIVSLCKNLINSFIINFSGNIMEEFNDTQNVINKYLKIFITIMLFMTMSFFYMSVIYHRFYFIATPNNLLYFFFVISFVIFYVMHIIKEVHGENVNLYNRLPNLLFMIMLLLSYCSSLYFFAIVFEHIITKPSHFNIGLSYERPYIEGPKWEPDPKDVQLKKILNKQRIEPWRDVIPNINMKIAQTKLGIDTALSTVNGTFIADIYKIPGYYSYLGDADKLNITVGSDNIYTFNFFQISIGNEKMPATMPVEELNFDDVLHDFIRQLIVVRDSNEPGVQTYRENLSSFLRHIIIVFKVTYWDKASDVKHLRDIGLLDIYIRALKGHSNTFAESVEFIGKTADLLNELADINKRMLLKRQIMEHARYIRNMVALELTMGIENCAIGYRIDNNFMRSTMITFDKMFSNDKFIDMWPAPTSNVKGNIVTVIGPGLGFYKPQITDMIFLVNSMFILLHKIAVGQPENFFKFLENAELQTSVQTILEENQHRLYKIIGNLAPDCRSETYNCIRTVDDFENYLREFKVKGKPLYNQLASLDPNVRVRSLRTLVSLINPHELPRFLMYNKFLHYVAVSDLFFYNGQTALDVDIDIINNSAVNNPNKAKHYIPGLNLKSYFKQKMHMYTMENVSFSKREIEGIKSVKAFVESVIKQDANNNPLAHGVLMSQGSKIKTMDYFAKKITLHG